MNTLRKSLSILLFFTVALTALAANPEVKDERRIAFFFKYTPAYGAPYNVTVPKTWDGTVTVLIPTADMGKWVVAVSADRDAKEFHIDAIDPLLSVFGGKDNPSIPVTVFSANFDLVYGKPITVVETPTYKLEITLTAE